MDSFLSNKSRTRWIVEGIKSANQRDLNQDKRRCLYHKKPYPPFLFFFSFSISFQPLVNSPNSFTNSACDGKLFILLKILDINNIFCSNLSKKSSHCMLLLKRYWCILWSFALRSHIIYNINIFSFEKYFY